MDNLNVVRQVGCLLDGVRSSRPAELVNDGDLIIVISKILELRESDTVRVTKVKGHADEEMVQSGSLLALVSHCYGFASLLHCHLPCGGQS